MIKFRRDDEALLAAEFSGRSVSGMGLTRERWYCAGR